MNADERMPMIWSADQYGVDVLVLEEFAVIQVAGDAAVSFPFFLL